MNYVLIHDNSVRYGPRPYLQGLFEAVAEDLVGVPVAMPATLEEGVSVLPNSLSLLPVKQDAVAPEYNPDLYQLSGPFYSVDLDGVNASYTVVPLPLEQAKGKLLAKVAAMRYEMEVRGTTCTIQGQQVNLLTNREDRNLYLQAYQLLSDQATQAWKFLPATWITLTKTDLGLVVQTIFTYVQTQYDWEKAKVEEINAVTTTVADLASINLLDA
jgi:hypothetical protein